MGEGGREGERIAIGRTSALRGHSVECHSLSVLPSSPHTLILCSSLPSQVARIVCSHVGDPETASLRLVQESLEKGSDDNITALVVDLSAEPSVAIAGSDAARMAAHMQQQQQQQQATMPGKGAAASSAAASSQGGVSPANSSSTGAGAVPAQTVTTSVLAAGAPAAASAGATAQGVGAGGVVTSSGNSSPGMGPATFLGSPAGAIAPLATGSAAAHTAVLQPAGSASVEMTAAAGAAAPAPLSSSSGSSHSSVSNKHRMRLQQLGSQSGNLPLLDVDTSNGTAVLLPPGLSGAAAVQQEASQATEVTGLVRRNSGGSGSESGVSGQDQQHQHLQQEHSSISMTSGSSSSSSSGGAESVIDSSNSRGLSRDSTGSEDGSKKDR